MEQYDIQFTYICFPFVVFCTIPESYRFYLKGYWFGHWVVAVLLITCIVMGMEGYTRGPDYP